MFNIAYAMGQGGAQGATGGGGFQQFIPLILMIVIFYFLLIRPQQKKTKDHREMVNSLKKGDWVITSGGIYGRITAVAENTLTIEISDRVRVKLNRASVSSLAQTGSTPPPAKKKKESEDTK